MRTEEEADFPGGSDNKESSCNAGNQGWIPGSGRSPGEGDGYQLQYSFLKNSMDRGAWWDSPWGRKEWDMTEPLTLSLFFIEEEKNENQERNFYNYIFIMVERNGL